MICWTKRPGVGAGWPLVLNAPGKIRPTFLARELIFKCGPRRANLFSVELHNAGSSKMDRLAHDWHIAPLWKYLLLGFLLQALMRVVMSALGAIELTYTPGDAPRLPYRVNFRRNLRGLHPNDRKGQKSDLWIATILGLLELWSYPVLMATGAWTVIGAWLGFKTVAQWRTWQENRFSYNRYLLGNALVVILSLIVLVPFVTTTPPACAP
jgi:hypothetical protein